MAISRQSKMTGRADLLYWLLNSDEPVSSLNSVAGLVGLEWQQDSLFKNKDKVKSTHTFTQKTDDRQTTDMSIIKRPVDKITGRLFCLNRRESLKDTAGKKNEQLDQPHSIQGLTDFTALELQPLGRDESLEWQELVRWTRLWPVLKRVSSENIESHIDLELLIQRVAKGEWIRRLPKKHLSHWAGEMTVLLDYNNHVLPFWNDFNRLCTSLIQLRGKQGLNIRILEELPGFYYTPREKPEAKPQSWAMPATSSPLLILSDLGMLGGDKGVYKHWLRFGRELKAASIQPFVLAPVSSQHINPKLCRYFDIALWDRNSRLSRQYQQTVHNQKPLLEQLLALLAPAIRIEVELLREVRHLLPDSLFDVGLEADFWQHPDIEMTAVACFLSPQKVEKYRKKFSDQPEDLQKKVLLLMRANHTHLFPAIVHEETLIWAELVSDNLLREFQTEINQAELFMRKMARMLYIERDNLDSSKSAYGQRNITRSHTSLRTKQLFYSVIEGVVNADKMDEGLRLRTGIDKEELRRTLNTGIQQQRQCILYQKGQELILDDFQAWQAVSGSPFSELVQIGNSLFVRQYELDKLVDEFCLRIETLPRVIAHLTPKMLKIHLDTGAEQIWLKGLIRPDWASQIGRDKEGLWVEFEQQGQSWRVYWPAWGGELSYDEYGLYNDLNIKGVVQRSRFIPPGTFQMGSPKSEEQRENDEIQHQVTLTQGYWLADTACTQALWQAVMGENPANFKQDKNNPVEQVSWDDVQIFLDRLNDSIPGLNSRLPSEAQWEYVCRAGTNTPFSFGENITPEQVNYDGENPYAGGKEGLYRKGTVSVKSFPANSWGLYEMHGNVWEWCQDWFGDYSKATVTNPAGSETGTFRVLRGGSWILHGRRTRSADRSRILPDSRSLNTGFRFAPGQAKCREAEPRVAASERGKQAQRDISFIEKLTDLVIPKK